MTKSASYGLKFIKKVFWQHDLHVQEILRGDQIFFVRKFDKCIDFYSSSSLVLYESFLSWSDTVLR